MNTTAMRLTPAEIKPGDIVDWPNHPHTVTSIQLLETRPDPLPDSYLISWERSDWDGSRGLQCSADDTIPIQRPN